MGFNAASEFTHLGGFPALGVPRYTLDGDRYNYDNGYVLLISKGNPNPIHTTGDMTMRARFPATARYDAEIFVGCDTRVRRPLRHTDVRFRTYLQS